MASHQTGFRKNEKPFEPEWTTFDNFLHCQRSIRPKPRLDLSEILWINQGNKAGLLLWQRLAAQALHGQGIVPFRGVFQECEYHIVTGEDSDA